MKTQEERNRENGERIDEISDKLKTLKSPEDQLKYLRDRKDEIEIEYYKGGGNIIMIPIALAVNSEMGYINQKINELESNNKTEDDPDTKKPDQKLKKITWKGTPSQFGYIILELVKHGFIDPPPYNTGPNFTGLARLCFHYFDIKTTEDNLIKELNPYNNTLSDGKRAQFQIPDLSDLD